MHKKFSQCPSCGHRLEAQTTECPNCGASLAVVSSTDRALEEDAMTAHSSGTPMPDAEENVIQALLTLAQRLKEQNNLSGALEAYRQARARTSGTQAQILDTLIQTLEEKQLVEHEKAEGRYRKVERIKPAEPPQSEEIHVSPRKRWLVAILLVLAAVLAVIAFLWLRNREPGFSPPLWPTSTSTPTATYTPTQTLTTTPTPTTTPTATPTPTLAPGATQVSEKDGMVMVYVPEGTFTMGSEDHYYHYEERPVHTVYLDAFWIDRTEVTNGMYAKCVQAGVCTSPFYYGSSHRNNYYGNSQYDNYPVIYVSWEQAKTYCEWTGRRLPTEAEWEKAARGTTGLTYPWGDNHPDGNLVNYNNYYRHTDTTEVGSYPNGASPYGALDMAGNVWEWVADWYGDNYYANSSERNPTGPDSGTARVVRGGSWIGAFVRTTYRSYYRPSVSKPDLGFRCVHSP